MTTDPIERAIAAGAIRALTRRAVALRQHAEGLSTAIEHHDQRVQIGSPESTVALATARLFEECADEFRELIR